MDKRFKYRQKNVHNVSIAGSFVRLWSTEGTKNSRLIEKAFRPLMKTSFVYPYVALMPDFHPGESSMIGSVIPTRDVLLPSMIGGDLGCGMTAIRLPLQAESISAKLQPLREILRERIPAGTSQNSSVTKRVEQNPIWKREVRASIMTSRLRKKLLRQFGSLGGGNHFLEIQEDIDGRVWVMLHSGSRYLGVAMRDYYVEAGQNQEGIDKKIYSKIPYLNRETAVASDYLSDLSFVLDFARESRKEMMIRVLEVFAELCPEVERAKFMEKEHCPYDLAHNFIAEEEHFGEKLFVHRKGATRAGEGEVGLIPGSMGTGSYIVEGRGNEFSFCSCSHGAGRAMSRAEAFRQISDKEFRRSMTDVVYEHDDRIKDESPIAYKDVKLVMRGQKDLVRILYELRPLVSIKGH